MGIRWQVFQSRWDEMYALACDYYQKHGNIWISPCYRTENGKRLGQWVARQRGKLYGIGGSSKLTKEQKIRLDQLGMIWQPYEEKWNAKYQMAKKFYLDHGHLNISIDFVTEEGVKLGMWLSSQRQAMRGNPNFLMTPERKRLLDEIGMDWTMRRISPNARQRS